MTATAAPPDPPAGPAAKALKSLRERAGLSVRDMAEAMNLPASTYRHYETNYRRSWLPPDIVDMAASALLPRGISETEIRALASGAPDWVRDGAPLTPAPMPEGAPSGTPGVFAVPFIRPGEGGRPEIDRGKRQLWHVPLDFIDRELESRDYNSLRAFILRDRALVARPSSSRDLYPRDRLLIDISDRDPSPAGVFLVDDGGDEYTARHVERLPAGRWRIGAFNPDFASWEVDPARDRNPIAGRVITVIRPYPN